MKLLRRSLSLILALLMVLALAACTPGSEPITDSEGKGDASNPEGGNDGGIQDKVESFVLPDRPTGDTEGNTYVVIQFQEVDNPFKYSQDSRMGEKVAERILEVQELYGCLLEFEQVAEDKFVNAMQSRIYSDNAGDLIFADINDKLRRTCGTGGSESLMQDLLQVDHIINFWDMEKWGNITAREAMMAGGTFYGVTPALWLDYTPLPYYLFAYNKDMLVQFDATDPQEYWENEAWDRDAMLDVITSCYDDSGSETVWGLTARVQHMTRASFLATGIDLVTVDKVNADGSVEWTNGLLTPEAKEALQWLVNSIKTNQRYFNNGQPESPWGPWFGHEPFLDGLCAMCSTRPKGLFDEIVTGAPFSFGVTLWAGSDPNMVTGFYEDVCSVAIPVFAQNVEHSAFLMYDLFEGLDGIESYEDVMKYYRENYFETDLDVEYLIRDGASLQYSYWPNGVDEIYSMINSRLMTASSVSALIDRGAVTVDDLIEEHVLPNKVTLNQWQAAGYFD